MTFMEPSILRDAGLQPSSSVSLLPRHQSAPSSVRRPLGDWLTDVPRARSVQHSNRCRVARRCGAVQRRRRRRRLDMYLHCRRYSRRRPGLLLSVLSLDVKRCLSILSSLKSQRNTEMRQTLALLKWCSFNKCCFSISCLVFLLQFVVLYLSGL